MLLDIPFLEEKTFMNRLIKEIDGAKETIKIFSPYLIIPNELNNAILRANLRGVIVIIITTGKADKRSAYIAAKYYAEKLSTYGVKILRTDNFFLHSKATIIDDEKLIIGTSNLDYRALFHHYETNFVLENKNTIKEMSSIFDNLAKRSYLLDEKSTN
jgi:cardiolipin synthase